MLSDEHRMLEAAGSIPEQHETMPPVTEQKSELGMDPHHRRQVPGATVEASRGEKDQLTVRAMKALMNRLHWLTQMGIAVRIRIIGPEEQRQLQRNPCRSCFEREQRRLPFERLQIVSKGVEAATPASAMKQQTIPLTGQGNGRELSRAYAALCRSVSRGDSANSIL